MRRRALLTVAFLAGVVPVWGHAAYCPPVGARATPVTDYVIHTNVTNLVPSSTFDDVAKQIRNGAQVWNEEGRLPRRLNYAGPTTTVAPGDGINTVSWTNNADVCGLGVFSCTATIVSGGAVTESDVFLLDRGGEQDWKYYQHEGTLSIPFAIDLSAVATHELGHVLGFTDSASCGSTTPSVMDTAATASVKSLSKHRYLDTEDLKMIRNNYGWTTVTVAHGKQSDDHGVSWSSPASPSLPTVRTRQRFAVTTNVRETTPGLAWVEPYAASDGRDVIWLSSRTGLGGWSVPAAVAVLDDSAVANPVHYAQPGVASDGTSGHYLVTRNNTQSGVAENHIGWRATTNGFATSIFGCVATGFASCSLGHPRNASAATYDPRSGYYVVVHQDPQDRLLFATVTTGGAYTSATLLGATSYDNAAIACRPLAGTGFNCLAAFADAGSLGPSNGLTTYAFKVSAAGVVSFAASGVYQASVGLYEPPAIVHDSGDSTYPFKLIHATQPGGPITVRRSTGTPGWNLMSNTSATTPLLAPTLGTSQTGDDPQAPRQRLNIYYVEKKD